MSQVYEVRANATYIATRIETEQEHTHSLPFILRFASEQVYCQTADQISFLMAQGTELLTVHKSDLI